MVPDFCAKPAQLLLIFFSLTSHFLPTASHFLLTYLVGRQACFPFPAQCFSFSSHFVRSYLSGREEHRADACSWYQLKAV